MVQGAGDGAERVAGCGGLDFGGQRGCKGSFGVGLWYVWVSQLILSQEPECIILLKEHEYLGFLLEQHRE